MQKLLLLLTVLFLHQSLYAQKAAPGWQWANFIKCQDNKNGDEITGTEIAADVYGNAYVTGNFSGATTFGNTYLDPANGGLFIAKYTAPGSLLWVKQYQGFAKAIAVGSDNCIYIHGEFSNHIDMGGITLTSFGDDVFVAKLDSNGSIMWAKSGGSTDRDGCYMQGMTFDRDNNLIIAGDIGATYSRVAYFDKDTINNDTYLVKYASDGKLIWAKGTTSLKWTNTVSNVGCDKEGNIYTSGGFYDTITFSGGHMITSTGWSAYIAKFNRDGDVIWAYPINNATSNNNSALVLEIVCDSKDNVYFYGTTNGSVNFGNITSNDSLNFFLAKYDSSGSAKWVKRFGSKEDYTVLELRIKDMCIDKNDNVSLMGNTFQHFYLDHTTTLLDSKNNEKVFVIQFDESGNFNWANFGGNGYTETGALCADANGQIFTTGGLHGSDSIVIFGASRFYVGGVRSAMYVAKIADVTGVSKISNEISGVSVYPNPATNELHINHIKSGTRIQLFDLSGRLLSDIKANKETVTLNTASLQPGSYLLKLTDTEGNTTCIKVVK